MASVLASQPVVTLVRSSLFERVGFTYILEPRVDWSSFAMTKDHLDLFQFEVRRVQSGEFFLSVRCAWYESGHVEKWICMRMGGFRNAGV